MTKKDFIDATLHISTCFLFGAGAWLLASDARILVWEGGFVMAVSGAMLIRGAVAKGIGDAKHVENHRQRPQ